MGVIGNFRRHSYMLGAPYWAWLSPVASTSKCSYLLIVHGGADSGQVELCFWPDLKARPL